jgi:tetratricopeptide (TPR) repeat protein
MRAFVFTNASLRRYAGQFVWLSINTEKAGNAAFLEKHRIEALPSFYVLEPAAGKTALRWVGGASVPQVEKILEDGRRAVSGPKRGVEELLAQADRSYGENNYAEAVEKYRDLLGKAPSGWPPYARALESLLFSLQQTGDSKSCAETAREAYPRLRESPSSANVAGSGLDCALSMKEADPARAGLVSALASDAREVVAARRSDLAVDDISSVYLTLAEEREAARDADGRKTVLTELASYLEGEAARAKTPVARVVFDSHRLSAYLQLNAPERALPMLEESERDLPDDYNPPARLAVAYKAMERWDDALAASDRALPKAYGPRKIGIWLARADILAGKGDQAAARLAVEQALAEAEAFPPGQRSESTIAALKKKLAGMPAAAAPRPCGA